METARVSIKWQGSTVEIEADTAEELGDKIGEWMESVGIDPESAYPISHTVDYGDTDVIKECVLQWEPLDKL